ncbi:MAG: hypothetical protein LKG24_00905 [Lacticaseibacillus songhuajiangensis]|jgi:hypothetical protein|nr:hypothetical protein [Lacticaseibacillus songhuajiangensis]
MAFEIVKTAELTTEMMNQAIEKGWTLHLHNSWNVKSTNKQGVVSVTPNSSTAARNRLMATRNYRGANSYSDRAIKTVHSEHTVKIAYLGN